MSACLARLQPCVGNACKRHGVVSVTRGRVRGAGSTVLVSPYLMHRDPQAWHNPEAFDISRWEGLGGASSAGFMATLTGMGPNGSYLPFGAGPRNCIGTGICPLPCLPPGASSVRLFLLPSRASAVLSMASHALLQNLVFDARHAPSILVSATGRYPGPEGGAFGFRVSLTCGVSS